MGATFVIVIGAVLYEMERQRNETKISKTETRQDLPQLPQESDDFESIKQSYIQLATKPKESFPVHTANLEKQIQLAEQALSFADTPEEEKWSKLSYLSASISLESTYLRNQIPSSKNFSRLKNAAAEWENDSDEIIAEEATLATLVLEIINHIRDEDWNSKTDEIKGHINKVLKRYPEKESVAFSLKQLLLMFRIEKKFLPVEIELRRMVGLTYVQNDNPEMKNFGQGFITDSLMLKYEIQTKENSFIVNRTSAAQELATAIQELIDNETLGGFTLVRLVGSCNVMELYGHYDLAMETVKKLTEVANQLPESTTADFRKVSGHTMTRCQAIGTPIKIAEKAADGTAINSSDLPKQPIVVFFVPGKSKQLPRLFELAEKVETAYEGDIKVIMIAINGSREDLVETAELYEVQSELIIDTDMSSQLYQQFPVATRPSMLVIDSNRIIKKMIIGVRDLDSALLEVLENEDE